MRDETKKRAGASHVCAPAPAKRPHHHEWRSGERRKQRRSGDHAKGYAVGRSGTQPVASEDARQAGEKGGALSHAGGGATRQGYTAAGRRWRRQWGSDETVLSLGSPVICGNDPRRNVSHGTVGGIKIVGVKIGKADQHWPVSVRNAGLTPLVDRVTRNRRAGSLACLDDSSWSAGRSNDIRDGYNMAHNHTDDRF